MASSIADPSIHSASECRSQSFSSDRPSISTFSHSATSPPPSAAPEAAFINEVSASQIIANSYDAFAPSWCDQIGAEPGGEPLSISAIALALVNSFLDQLLHNFLQAARSTSLHALRPAVCEVLKPKLARDTIHNADEELREFLGDANEDEDGQLGNEHEWDLDLAWKRVRLRCMVYSSLGEFEEEDEDVFMQQENLDNRANENTSGVISAAVAIFLTSVIEYMGELTLKAAGQSAYQRVQSKMKKDVKDGTRERNDRADPIIIEEMDMERVALDRTLGRLWRAWKKRLRGLAIDSSACSVSGTSSDAGEFQDSRSPMDAAPTTEKDHLSNAPTGLQLSGSEQHSEDESEQAANELLRLSRRRPTSLGATPTSASGLRMATVAERHPAVLMLHRRFSMPTSHPPALHRDATRSKLGSRIATRPETRSESQAAYEIPIPVRDRRRTPLPSARVKRGDGLNSDSDDALEHAVYEKAEIVKSSRVSVASISSRSCSSSSGSMSARRASGDHSARIIDVPAPRSPIHSIHSIHSHRQSLDTAERCHPASGFGSVCRGQTSPIESPRRMQSWDNAPRASGAAARSPVDKVRPGLQSASTISESDEEYDDRPAKAPMVFNVAPPARSTDRIGRVPYALQTSLGYADRRMPSPKLDQLTPVKVMSATERTKAKDAEEEGASVLHSTVPPRPIHTSGSSGSNGGGTGTGTSTGTGTGTGRPKAWISSEDSSSRAESVARNFEELIQSNQTISYTLTPENMRDIKVKSPNDSSILSKIGRKSEDLRSPSSIEGSGSPLTRRATPGVSPIAVEFEHSRPNAAVPRAPTGTAASAGRAGGPQARAARVPTESLADFAEFIKSTGPAGDRGPSALRMAAVPSSPAKLSRQVSTGSSDSNRSSNRSSRHQPRDPRPDSSEHGELVRQGSSSTTGSQHRIPRHVAPFRTTMDSDQFNGLPGGRAVDASLPEIRYSQGSNTYTENSMPSMQSFNSSSALLRGSGSGYAGKQFTDEDVMPARKTQRVRDPYAIDFSDESDGFNDTAPVAPRKNEESLAEFLRNYEPPASHVPQAPQAPQPQQAKALRKAHSQGLMGRFSRGGSKETGDSAGKETPALPSNSRGDESRSSSTRVGAGKHTPLVVNMPPGYDKYGPIPGFSESSDAAPAARVPMQKSEVRHPVGSTDTLDLANFLRNSGPLPGQDLAFMPAHQEQGSGLSKVLGRRKKMTPT